MELRPGYKPGLQAWTEVTVDDLKSASENALSTGPFGSSIGAQFFQESGVPVIRGSNLAHDGRTHLVDFDYVFVSEQKAAELHRSVVVEGDLIFTCWGTISQVGLIGDRAAYSRYIISNKQMKFTPDRRKANSRFLFYLFSGPDLQRQIITQSIGTSVPGFNLGQLRSLHFRIPPLPQQKAIAEALSDVDTLIESLEQLLAKKRQIKQGAMQELIIGKKRLPGFSGEWELRRLGDTAEITMGQSPSSTHYNSKGDGLPLIQGNADIRDRKTIKRMFTTEVNKRGRCGDILLSVRAPVGEVSRATFDVCLGRGVCSIRYRNDFLYYALIAQEPAWSEFVKGSTFDSVNSTDVRAFGLRMPEDHNEQSAIAAILSDMDAELAALESRLTKARAIKQGMMHELLTGRIRLI